MSSAPPPASSGGACGGILTTQNVLRVLRLIGVALGVLVIILGVIRVIGASGVTVLKSVVNGLYMILFGSLIILSEVRLWRVLKKFSFLMSYTGLGLYYIFVGGLALGGHWYEKVLCAAFGFVGFVYIIAGTFLRFEMPGVKEALGGAPATGSAAAAPSATPMTNRAAHPPPAAQVNEQVWGVVTPPVAPAPRPQMDEENPFNE